MLSEKSWGRRKSTLLLVFSAFLFLTACSEDKDESKSGKPKFAEIFGVGVEHSADALKKSFRIVDTGGRVIPNAEILIGSGLDTPFRGNYLRASNAGVFTAPADWKTEQTVTISAPGFIRTSYANQMPVGRNFVLRKLEPTDKYELRGEGTGFQSADLDDKMEFAVMLPAMTMQEVFSFNISNFMSGETDNIKVIGQDVGIPTNVSLPKQTENYIINVTLAKPTYRMYFNSLGDKMVYVLRGNFPFKKTVREVQNKKKFNELINNIEITGGSLRKVSLTGPSTVENLPVNELTFDQKRSFTAPAIGADDILLAAAISPYQNYMLPTDIKNAQSNQVVNMTVPGNVNPLLLTVLTKENEMKAGTGRISATLLPFTGNVSPTQLPLIDSPSFASNVLKWSIGPTPTGVNEIGLFAYLSKIDRTMNGKREVKTYTRIWEVYGKQWGNEFTVPQWPNEPASTDSKQWEILLLGSNSAKNVIPGPEMFDSATHATHAQVEFQ